MARSTYATWRQDPYLDRDEDGEAFLAGKDEEDDIDERYTWTAAQREAYERDGCREVHHRTAPACVYGKGLPRCSAPL